VKLGLGLVLLAMVVARPLGGQSSPEDVVRAFFKAEDDGRWIDAARMLDLKRFEAIHRDAVNGLRNRDKYHRATAEDLMKLDPDMPRAAAEYQIRMTNAYSRVEDILSQQFARVPTVDSLAALSTEEAAARWLEAEGPEWTTDRSIQHSRMPLVDCPGLSASEKRAMLIKTARDTRSVVVGSTSGSDSIRYVVVGQEFSPPRATVGGFYLSPRVMTLVNVAGFWRIVPSGDMPRSNGLGGSSTFAISCAKEPFGSRERPK